MDTTHCKTNCKSLITISDRSIPPNLNMPPPNLQHQLGAEKQLPSLLSLKVDPPDQLNSEGTDEESGEVVLAQALEDVLALKNRRERELGTEDASKAEASLNKLTDDVEDDDNVVGFAIFFKFICNCFYFRMLQWIMNSKHWKVNRRRKMQKVVRIRKRKRGGRKN